jgi:hypothetical protein
MSQQIKKYIHYQKYTKRAKLIILLLVVLMIVLTIGINVMNTIYTEESEIGKYHAEKKYNKNSIIENAEIIGNDKDGNSIHIKALNGVEDVDHQIKLNSLEGRIMRKCNALEDKQGQEISIKSKSALLNSNENHLALREDVEIRFAGNSQISGPIISIDYSKTLKIYSKEKIALQTLGGSITANAFTLDVEKMILQFEGNVNAVFHID